MATKVSSDQRKIQRMHGKTRSAHVTGSFWPYSEDTFSMPTMLGEAFVKGWSVLAFEETRPVDHGFLHNIRLMIRIFLNRNPIRLYRHCIRGDILNVATFSSGHPCRDCVHVRPISSPPSPSTIHKYSNQFPILSTNKYWSPVWIPCTQPAAQSRNRFHPRVLCRKMTQALHFHRHHCNRCASPSAIVTFGYGNRCYCRYYSVHPIVNRMNPRRECSLELKSSAKFRVKNLYLSSHIFRWRSWCMLSDGYDWITGIKCRSRFGRLGLTDNSWRFHIPAKSLICWTKIQINNDNDNDVGA